MQDVQGAAAADAARSHETTRVLVVDDNENNLLVMTNMLVPNGYIVELARSGEECLQILSSRIGTGAKKNQFTHTESHGIQKSRHQLPPSLAFIRLFCESSPLSPSVPEFF